jgi:hypothetical protein
MAYSNRAQLHMLADELSEAVRVGNQAIALADQLGNPEILSHALNNVGTAEALAGSLEPGRQKLESSLQIARMHELHEHVARAYTNLASLDVKIQGIRRSDALLERWHHLFHRARSRLVESLYACLARPCHLEQGRWQEAGEDALTVLNNPRSSSITRIPALAALGCLRVRRGDPDVEPVLDEARDRRFLQGKSNGSAPVAAARAEAAWWQGKVQSNLLLRWRLRMNWLSDNRLPGK